MRSGTTRRQSATTNSAMACRISRARAREADFSLVATNAYVPDGRRAYTSWALDAAGNSHRHGRRHDARLDGVGPRQPRGPRRDSRHRAGRRRRRSQRARRQCRRRRHRSCTRIGRTLELRHGQRAHRQRNARGADRARRAGDRRHRVRALPQGDGRHDDCRRAPHAAENWAQSVAVAHLGMERRNGRWRVASSVPRSCRRTGTARIRR